MSLTSYLCSTPQQKPRAEQRAVGKLSLVPIMSRQFAKNIAFFFLTLVRSAFAIDAV